MLKVIALCVALVVRAHAQNATAASPGAVPAASDGSCFWSEGFCEAPFCVEGASARVVSCLSGDPTAGCVQGCEAKKVSNLPPSQANGLATLCALQGHGAQPLQYFHVKRVKDACGSDPQAANLNLSPGGPCTQAMLNLLVQLGCKTTQCQDDFLNQSQRADTCFKQRSPQACGTVRMPCAQEFDRETAGVTSLAARPYVAALALAAVLVAAAALL